MQALWRRLIAHRAIHCYFRLSVEPSSQRAGWIGIAGQYFVGDVTLRSGIFLLSVNVRVHRRGPHAFARQVLAARQPASKSPQRTTTPDRFLRSRLERPEHRPHACTKAPQQNARRPSGTWAENDKRVGFRPVFLEQRCFHTRLPGTGQLKSCCTPFRGSVWEDLKRGGPGKTANMSASVAGFACFSVATRMKLGPTRILLFPEASSVPLTVFVPWRAADPVEQQRNEHISGVRDLPRRD